MSEFVERKIAGLTVRIDREMCISTVACTRIAPEALEMDEEQIVAFRDEIGEIDRERMLEACQVCPVQALVALGEDGEPLS